MDQIIHAIAQKLNLPEAIVRQGVTVVLNFLKEQSKGTQFEAFLNMIPGAPAVAAAPLPTGGGGGGLLGGLVAAAGSMLGGQTGEIAKAVSGLQSAGLTADQVAPFVQSFFEETKQHVGPEEIEKILTGIPALQSLLGGAKA